MPGLVHAFLHGVLLMTRFHAPLLVGVGSFVFTLASGIGTAAQCDDKCRMRQYIKLLSCLYLEQPDCLVCAASNCLPNDPPVPNGNTYYRTLSTQRSKSADSCTTLCEMEPCDTSVFVPTTNWADYGFVYVCPLYDRPSEITPPGGP